MVAEVWPTNPAEQRRQSLGLATHHCLLLSPSLAPVSCAKPSGPMGSQLPTAGHISFSSSHNLRLGLLGPCPPSCLLHQGCTPQTPLKQSPCSLSCLLRRGHAAGRRSLERAGPLPSFHQHPVSCQQHPEPPHRLGSNHVPSTTAAGFTSLDPLCSCLMPHQENMCRSTGQADAAPGGAAAGCGPLPGEGELGHGGGPAALSCLPPWISPAPRIGGGGKPKVLLWLSRAG